jgi:primary-amine oxidase
MESSIMNNKFIFALSLQLVFSIALGSEVHPLEDLSESEVKKAVEIIKQSKKFAEDIRFPILSNKEPLKKDLLISSSLPRKVFAAVFEKKKNRFSEVVVNLREAKIESVEVVKNAQPPVLLEEYERMNKIVRADPLWQQAIKKRGIQNFDSVYVDSWAPGLRSIKEIKGGFRLMRGLSYYKGERTNYYARPIEGIVVTVDMNTDRVLEVRDTGVVPIAQTPQELSAEAQPKLRDSLKPLVISQPKGSSFKVEGQKVEWDKWRFRFSVHPLYGLVLHEIKYKDGDRDRSILYKASLSEMVVPYGDTDPNWAFRNAFDVGEYGLGRTAHSLEVPVDVPTDSYFHDAVFTDDLGEVLKIPRAVAVYERDGGLLWKHMDQNNRNTDARRGRELVVTFMTTIGNYDYGLNWIFKQDASIELEIYLTGIMLAKGSELSKNPCRKECKHLVEPKIISPNHQHFFAFRLDFDIEEAPNSVSEIDAEALPEGPLNPFHNAFQMVRKTIFSEKEGGRDLDFKRARKWKVYHSDKVNGLDHPVGYALLSGENSSTFLKPSSLIRRRATFLEHPVWFTRYHDEEQGAAGLYPNQHLGGEGLKKMISNNEALDKQDVVLWYVMGITHFPRPEEWPIMPAHRAGFKLVPVNFFDKNPSMDLPK